MTMTFSDDGCEIITTRILPWPPARVFAAWTDPAPLARWWGPKGFTNTFEEFDPRPGGHWRFVMHGPDGKNYPNHCVFTEVTAPQRIVLDHVSDPHFVLTVTFDAAGNNGQETRVVFRQRFDSAHICAVIAQYAGPANEENFDRLTAVLSDA